jgi:ubiquinol-cytochrome c reductase cytochrome b subunit
LGLKNNIDKIPFHPFFSIKDIIGFIIILLIFIILNFKQPFIFIDPENFFPANPIITPPHIQPE